MSSLVFVQTSTPTDTKFKYVYYFLRLFIHDCFFQKTLLEKSTNDIGTFPVLVYFFPPPSTRKTLQLCWNCFSSCVKVIKIYSFTIPARTYECRLGHNKLKADTEYVMCVLLQKAVLPEICKKLLKSFKSSMKSVFIVKINNSKGSSLKHQLTQQTMLATLASLFTFRYPCALRLNYFAPTHTPTPRVCHLSSVRNEKSCFSLFHKLIHFCTRDETEGEKAPTYQKKPLFGAKTRRNTWARVTFYGFGGKVQESRQSAACHGTGSKRLRELVSRRLHRQRH